MLPLCHVSKPLRLFLTLAPPPPLQQRNKMFLKNKGSADVLEVSKAASGICLPVFFFISFESCLLIRMWISNTGTSTPVISFIFDIRYDKILSLLFQTYNNCINPLINPREEVLISDVLLFHFIVTAAIVWGRSYCRIDKVWTQIHTHPCINNKFDKIGHMASSMDLITNTPEGVADGTEETEYRWVFYPGLQLLIQPVWVGGLLQSTGGGGVLQLRNNSPPTNKTNATRTPLRINKNNTGVLVVENRLGKSFCPYRSTFV